MASGRMDEHDPLDNYDPGPPPPEPAAVEYESTQHGPASDRVSPIEMGAERSVLAAILTTPKVYDEVCDELVAEDFGAPVHEAIYAAISACDASGRPFDVITVADEMSRAGTLGQRGPYLEELTRATITLDSLEAHVQIVLDRSLRRRMVTASRAIGAAALNPEHDSQEALDVAEQHVFELSQRRKAASLAPMATILAKTSEEMTRARTMKVVGHPTGITRLDEVTGGLRGGQFVIVCGRPAMGKSVLALQMAHHIAEVEDLPVPVFSYEMSHTEMGVRLLAARTGISMNELTRGRVPTEDGMDRVFAREYENLGKVRLLIDDAPPPTVNGLRSEIRRLARRGPLGAVVVDYLQLLTADSRRADNRTQEVATISRTLKMLAVELDVPVIAVSQLSRQGEGRPDKRPMLHDLRESGSLEQDANLVLAVYRDWVYDRTQPETEAELLVLKNRQGPLDQIALDFEGPLARFRNSGRTLERGPVLPAGPATGGGPGGGRGQLRTDLF